MQGKISLLKKSSLVLILIILTIASCKTLVIWNIPEKEFHENIKSGDFDFLKKINTKHINISELESLGPGTVFYMAFVFEEMGRLKERDKFLIYEIENGNDPWREEALYRLAKSYLKKENYKKAEKLIRNNKRKVLKDARVERIYIESLYWQHKDKQVLKQIRRINLNSKVLKQKEIDELALFKAVSSARLGKRKWQKLFKILFSEQQNSMYHKRAWDFLAEKDSLLKDFSETDLNLFKAQKYLALRNYERAAGFFESYINGASVEDLSASIIDNSLKAFIYASGKLEHAKLLTSVYDKIQISDFKEDIKTGLLFSASFSSGKLYRKLNNFHKAEKLFSQSMKHSADNHDLALWYLLDSSFKLSINKGLEALDQYAEEIKDPDYFSDIFENISTDLILNSDYSSVLSIYNKMTDSRYNRIFSSDIRARYAYILLVAGEHSFIKSFQLNNIKKDILKTIENSGSLYYLSKISSDKKISFPWNVNYNMILPLTENEEILNGLLKYGFYNKVYREIRSDIYSFNPDFLKKAAFVFNENGLYLESISIMGILSSITDKKDFHKSDFKILYPQGHKEAVKKAAEKAGLDPDILFALVRSESAFKEDIRSRAGAVGLSQLMPATAEEEARKLRLKNPDLNDPEVNTLIGASYFSRLIKRFGSESKALAAYNAGPGRVRRWERKYSYVPEELFPEIIPYPETKNYVKSVIEASQYYKYLYETK